MDEISTEADPKEFIKRLKRLKGAVERMGESIRKESDAAKITKRFRDIEAEFAGFRELMGEGDRFAGALVARVDEKKREGWLKEVETLGGEIEKGYREMLLGVEESREISLDKLAIIRKAKEVLDSFFGRKQNKEPRFFDRKG